ncbi:MAG: MMPL family transporter, partial [Spirochaetota bacterium]
PQDTAERKAIQKIKELYNVDSEILIAYEVPDTSDPQVMAWVRELTRALRHDGQTPEDSDSPLIQEIQSLSTVSIMRLDQNGQPEQIKLESVHGAAQKEALRDWALFRKALYSEDFRYGAIIIRPRLNLSSAQHHKLYQNVQDTLRGFEGKGLRFFLSGEAVIQSAVGDYILRDLLRLIPLLGLIVCAILYGYFRRISALLIILFPVVFSLLLTIGLMGWLGAKFTFIHASIPVIIMALGSADSIHTLNHFRQKDRRLPLLQRMLASQRELLLPITLTSITTSIGFLSFAGSIMLPIRSFGIFSAVGIGLAWLSSLFIAPILLPLYSPRHKVAQAQSRFRVARRAWDFTCLLLRHRRLSSLLLLLCSAGLLLSSPHVPINNDTISYFHPNSPIVRASNIINDKLSGIYSLDINIEAGESGRGLTEPVVLQYMDALAAYLHEQNPDLLGRSIGLQDFV